MEPKPSSERRSQQIRPAGITALPVEILARCFFFLPEELFGRLSILHVSRTWRTTAFSFPETWSVIRISQGDPSAHLFLNLVLLNTASYPVDFHFTSSAMLGTSSEDMSLVVAEHLERFRSIAWTASPMDAMPLETEAPFLEHVSGRILFPIASRFLGGVPGRLRSLELDRLCLPRRCPALATLRHLKSSVYARESGFLHMLFDICPQLESLDLGMMIKDPAFQPRGPAPQSLRRLRLEIIDCGSDPRNDANCKDLYSLCRSWRLGPLLQSLELVTFSLTVTDMYLSLILDGADSLAVLTDSRTCITARHTGGKNRTKCLRSHVPGDVSKIAKSLAASTLADLRSLAITSDVFRRFTSEGGVLPALTHLHLIVNRGQWVPARSDAPPWTHLYALAQMPQLEAVDIDVRHSEDALDNTRWLPALPNAAHAQSLLATLAAGLTHHVTVSIRGFPPDVAGAVSLPL
ncbi:hypothetical protein AURDEDRAFT_189132, partial [Auricularia subglabra TFB-10046 SS5]